MITNNTNVIHATVKIQINIWERGHFVSFLKHFGTGLIDILC